MFTTNETNIGTAHKGRPNLETSGGLNLPPPLPPAAGAASPSGDPRYLVIVETKLEAFPPTPTEADDTRPATLALAWEKARISEALDANAVRRIASDLNMFAKVTQQSLDKLPCSPLQLRPVMKKVHPASFHMSLHRWQSIKSSAARVLKLTGWVDIDAGDFLPLDTEWKAAVASLPQPGQKASFTAFARYCLGNSITPAAVDLPVIEAYAAWRAERTLALEVVHTASITRRLWHTVQSNHPSWPKTAIPTPRDPRRVALDPQEFTQEFQAAVHELTRDMRVVKPLDPRFTKKYSQATITCTRGILFRAATIIVKDKGGVNAVTSLHDVLSPASFRTILQHHFEHTGDEDQWAASARTFACTLKRVARISGCVSEGEMEELKKMAGLVKAPAHGLSKRSRDRVAQFQDRELMARLAQLPAKLFAEAEVLRKSNLLDRAAKLHCRATQLVLLIHHPLRRRNLAELDMVKHLVRDSKGRIVRLVIPADDTKNGKIIESLIPPELAARLDEYIRVHRSRIGVGAGQYLWPGAHGGHTAPETIARNLQSLVATRLGADFNVHLMRHIVATLLLEEDPRNMPIAQQMLGHWNAKVTERAYGHARTHAAQKAWGEKLGKFAADPRPPTKKD